MPTNYHTWKEEREARIMAEMQRNAALAQLKALVFEASHYLHGTGDNAQHLANEIQNAERRRYALSFERNNAVTPDQEECAKLRPKPARAPDTKHP